MLAGIVSGLIWFTFFWSGHIVFFHFRRVPNRFQVIARFFLASLAGHALTVTLISAGRFDLGRAFHGGAPVAAMCGWLVLLCLFVLYMPFYYTIATSISVQTMIHIDRSPAGGRQAAELSALFASKKILLDRLASMVANGYLMQQRDTFRAAPKGRLVGRIFGVFKSTWRLGTGG